MGVEESRAEFMVDLMGRYAGTDSRILEVGCRAGNNLVPLYRAGFRHLEGIEGNPGKVRLFRDSYPGISERIKVYCGEPRDLLARYSNGEFDVVFTVGFFFDKAGDFGWLYPELARITSGHLISIEKEGGTEPTQKETSYKSLYEPYGLHEIESIDVSAVEGLESVFFARIFERTP